MAQKAFLIGERCPVLYEPNLEPGLYNGKIIYITKDPVYNTSAKLMINTDGGVPTQNNGGVLFLEARAGTSSYPQRFNTRTHISTYDDYLYDFNSTCVGGTYYIGVNGSSSGASQIAFLYGAFDINAGTWAKTDNSYYGTGSNFVALDPNGTGTDEYNGAPYYMNFTFINTNTSVYIWRRQQDYPSNTATTAVEYSLYKNSTFAWTTAISSIGVSTAFNMQQCCRSIWDGTSTFVHVLWLEGEPTSTYTQTYTNVISTSTFTLSATKQNYVLKHNHLDYVNDTIGTETIIGTFGQNTQDPYKFPAGRSFWSDQLISNPINTGGTCYVGLIRLGGTGTTTGYTNYRTNQILSFDPTSKTPTFSLNEIPDTKKVTYGYNGKLVINGSGSLCFVQMIDSINSTSSTLQYSGYDALITDDHDPQLIYYVKGTSTSWSTSTELYKLSSRTSTSYTVPPGAEYVKPSDDIQSARNFWVSGIGADWSGYGNYQDCGYLVYSNTALPSGIGVIFNAGWDDSSQQASTYLSQNILGTIVVSTSSGTGTSVNLAF